MDFARLTTDGCVAVRDAIATGIFEEFEATMHVFALAACRKRGIDPGDREPMVVLLEDGGQYRRLLFPHLKNFRVLRQLEWLVIDALDSGGFFAWSGIEMPAFSTFLKADVPGEEKYLLPMHQDYNTPCHRAWRAWVPLRRADPEGGTIRFVRGSQALGFVHHNDADPERPQVPDNFYDEASVEMVELDPGAIFIFEPLLVHGSVASKADRMKYALAIYIWDIATLANPNDPDDPINQRLSMGKQRDRLRGDHDPIAIATRT